MTTLFDLKDNTVLLLGGFGFMAGTIGPELEKAGATIIVGDKKKNKTHPLAKNPYYHVNATSPASLQKCREKMEKNGHQIDHIINFIGGLRETGLTDIFKTSAQEIQKTVNDNLLSQLLPIRFLGEHLAQNPNRNKSITLISSINALSGYSIPFYTAAKGGLNATIKPLAIDLGSYNIRINIVTPGTIDKKLTEKPHKNYEDRAKSAALGRLACVEDVTNALLFCLTNKSLTAQNIVIDAGQSANPSSSLYDQARSNETMQKNLTNFTIQTRFTP